MEPENKPIATPKTHLQFGILTFVVLATLFVIYYVINVSQTGIARWVPAILLVILIIIAQSVHAKAMQGNVTYGNLFAAGFKTTVVATCLYLIFIVLFVVLVPSFKEQAVQMARQQMQAKGTLSDDQINTALNFTRKFFLVFLIAGVIFGNLIFGVLASLIGAAIPKKNPHPAGMQ